MDTPDELIKNLTAGLKPVKPVAPQWQRTAMLAVIGFALTFGAVFIVGARVDLGGAMKSSGFIAETLLLFFAGILSASAAATLAVPDTRLRLPVKLPLAMANIIWLWLLAQTTGEALGHDIAHAAGEGQCTIDLALLLILPLATAVFFMLRGNPVWRGMAGYALTFAMVSFAAAALRFLCPNDDGAHLLLWHFLPALAMVAGGIALGFFVFRRT